MPICLIAKGRTSVRGVLIAWVLMLLAGSPLAIGQSETKAVTVPDNECACLWQGSFTDVAATTDLVALGRVVRVKGNAVDLEIEQSLLGSTWLEEVRVWMKARNYCRPEPSRFTENSRWIMALQQIKEVPEDGFDPSTPNLSYGRQYDYLLSSCGGFFLNAQGNTVTGNLLPEMPRWEYQPEMTPVLITLIQGYLEQRIPLEALIEASKEDPAVKDLMLDTKSFLRGQADWLVPDSEEGT